MSLKFKVLEETFEEGLDESDEIYSLVFFEKREILAVCGQDREVRIYCTRSYKELKSYKYSKDQGGEISPKLAKWDDNVLISCFEKKWELVTLSLFSFERENIRMEEADLPEGFKWNSAFLMVMRISNDRLIFQTIDSKLGIFSISQRKIVKTLVDISDEMRRYSSMKLSQKFADSFYVCNSEILNSYQPEGNEKEFEKKHAVAVRINYENNTVDQVYRNYNLTDYDNIYSNCVYTNPNDIEILILTSDRDVSFYNGETGNRILLFETPDKHETRSSALFNSQFLITGRWFWSSGDNQHGSIEIYNLFDDSAENDNEYYVKKLGSKDFYHDSGISNIQVTKKTSDNSFILASGGYDSVVKFLEVENLPRIRLSRSFLEKQDLEERVTFVIESRSTIFVAKEETESSELLIRVKLLSSGVVFEDLYKSLF